MAHSKRCTGSPFLCSPLDLPKCSSTRRSWGWVTSRQGTLSRSQLEAILAGCVRSPFLELLSPTVTSSPWLAPCWLATCCYGHVATTDFCSPSCLLPPCLRQQAR